MLTLCGEGLGSSGRGESVSSGCPGNLPRRSAWSGASTSWVFSKDENSSLVAEVWILTFTHSLGWALLERGMKIA